MNRSMKYALTAIMAFFFTTSLFAQEEKEFDYVGVKTCGMCHKKDKDGAQLSKWEEGPHSGAYETLMTEEADKIAKELGHGDKAVEADACLKCHATGFDLAAERLGKRFSVEDGVQCETCHGPGSEYKSMKIMKDHQLSVDNGMRDFVNDESIEDFCITCHNEESPTYKEFVFEEQWSKVAHPIPAEE